MGYEKPPPKLKFYKAFFSAQWKFLIHMIVQCMSVKRTAWNKISSFMASSVICLATDVDTAVGMDADIQGRMEEDVIAVKEINATEILDEQMAKRLQDEEIEQADAREKPEKEDLIRAKVLQQQYDQKQENIDWNVVAKHMQENHLDNIKRYQSLKRKPISIAQDKENMIVYLKNMAGYMIAHFKGMTYDQVRPIFEREYNKVQTFLKPDRHEEPAKKRAAKETLLQERYDIYMLAEKDCPLSNQVMTLMLSSGLQVEEDSEVARDLVMKIFLKANQPKSKSLDTSSNFGVDVVQDFKKMHQGNTAAG
nr:hypothetical protein [Tanacetum cinerariifolium]